MPAKVVVRDLRKSYGGIDAARGVSFEIRDGEIFGLLGPNGAGKTTTVECIIGLREPDAGTVEVCGIDARLRPREVKRKIGAALQTTALQDKITPREALNLFRSFYSEKSTATQLLERFGLGDKADAPFDSLSAGQRQRVALALAFVNKPELVFLDEPTTGLDAQSRRELHGEILQMKRDGHTVLLTTHYMEEAETLCDRIAVIDKGTIVASGSTRDLIAGSKATPAIRVTTSRPIPATALSRVAGLTDLAVEGPAIRFRAADVNKALGEMIKVLDGERATIVDLRVHTASLEDVFLELTGPGADN